MNKRIIIDKKKKSMSKFNNNKVKILVEYLWKKMFTQGKIILMSLHLEWNTN